MTKIVLFMIVIAVAMTTFVNYCKSSPINSHEYSLDNNTEQSRSVQDQINNSEQEIESGGNNEQQLPKSPEPTVKIIKREIDRTSRQFALSDILLNVEESLFNSALGVSNIFKDITTTKTTGSESFNLTGEGKSAPTASEPDTTTLSPLVLLKRHTDLVDTTTPCPTTTDLPPQTELLQHINVKEIESNGDQPAHLAVDRVTVYAAKPGGHLPMVPSFDLNYYNGSQHGAIKEIIDAKNSSNLKDELTTTTPANLDLSTALSDDEVIKSTVLNPVVTSAQLSSSSETITTSTPSSTTKSATSKTPEKDLKEAEEELKEKVAEIEAEPIILSARV